MVVNWFFQFGGIIISLLVSILFTKFQKPHLKRICLIALLIIGVILSYSIYQDSTDRIVKIGTILFLLVYVVIVISGFISVKSTTSKWWMNRKIYHYTQLAATDSIIRIWGGDINFFDNYLSDTTKGIWKNKAFLQLKTLETRGITAHILCKRPVSTTEKLRIGFLAKNLNRIQFSFYKSETDECAFCEFNTHCLGCIDGAVDKKCCPLLKGYCPDLKFRGRIITQNNNANYVFVANWISHDRTYEKIRVYEPNTRECNFYLKLWDFLWNNAQQYHDVTESLIEQCIKLCDTV